MENDSLTTGGGRKNATNVPERALIREVRWRSVLYDKAQPNYRKSEALDQAWSEVASQVGMSVTNCKKRWKSLRDTFSKYYRCEFQYKQGTMNKQMAWSYYQDLQFLKPHVELYRLQGGAKESFESPASYSLENVELVIEEDEKEVYEIKIAEECDDETEYVAKQENLHETYDEQTEENEEYEALEQDQSNEAMKEDETIYKEHIDSYDNSRRDSVGGQVALNSSRANLTSDSLIPIHTNSFTEESYAPSKTIIDDDERYLMSCLPAFKRFSPQQKAFVRKEIEKLFYEVEFENVSEPKNKRLRKS